MTRRRYMTKRGKHIPLRGGSVALRSEDRQWASGKESLSNKPVLPEKGSLFGSEKLGEIDPFSHGKPIAEDKHKGKKSTSGFGLPD